MGQQLQGLIECAGCVVVKICSFQDVLNGSFMGSASMAELEMMRLRNHGLQFSWGDGQITQIELEIGQGIING
jgi:hypothetical protein